MYQRIIRPLFFQTDPEWVHHQIISVGEALQQSKELISFTRKLFTPVSDPVQLMGLHFPNKIGLAAGFDKNGRCPWFWYAQGFGFIEIGGITPKPQPGNKLPRIFRLPKDQAIINRMGFNNDGADAVATYLLKVEDRLGRLPIPLGVNLGKNKWTPNELAARDFLITFQKLYSVGDFFVVNVSSPNTPGLRQLQDSESLKLIISNLKNEREKYQIKKPILFKIAPDLSNDQVSILCDLANALSTDGLIVSNTTLSRENLVSPVKFTQQTGGLSGKPVKARSTELISLVRKNLPQMPIIGVGGIFSEQDAIEKIKAGANMLQVYTGYIYEGPMMVKRWAKAVKNVNK